MFCELVSKIEVNFIFDWVSLITEVMACVVAWSLKCCTSSLYNVKYGTGGGYCIKQYCAVHCENSWPIVLN